MRPPLEPLPWTQDRTQWRVQVWNAVRGQTAWSGNLLWTARAGESEVSPGGRVGGPENGS